MLLFIKRKISIYHVLITNENLTFLIEKDQFFEITAFLELIFPKLQIKNFLKSKYILFKYKL